MKTLLQYLLMIVVVLGFVYGGYWVAKTVSYKIFYKDMVIQTIHDNVRQDCLNNEGGR